MTAALVIAVAAACSPFGRSYETNGERIFFTATNEGGRRIDYEGGAGFGFMGGPRLTCASCHGADAEGGTRFLHMTRIEAPDIRWSTLASEDGDDHGDDGHGEYDIETFRDAVTAGRHPDGSPLSSDMPRWELSEGDLRDLAEYLQSLP